MKMDKIKQNPFLLFTPFLFIYLIIVFVLHKGYVEGDESRYVEFAQNLTNGFYSPPAPDISLWNGPGYPLFLFPFIYAKLPLICITVANAIFLYLSLIFLYKTLQKLSNNKIALVLTVFWGCYFNYYKEMALILTESITIFLITALAYNIVKALTTYKKSSIILSGLLLGYLALTKIIFGYVILLLIIISFLIILFNKQKKTPRTHLIICLIALLVNIPYLIYTFNLTGKVLYWGNSGGMSLYWMSTPYDNEYGDWQNESLTLGYSGDTTISHRMDSVLKKNHTADYQRILQYKGARRDDEFKKVAIENIKSHPKKFVLNCVYNAERLLFDTPFSYTFQTPNTGIKVPLPATVLILLLLTVMLSVKYWKTLLPVSAYLAAVVIIYLGLSITVSAYARQFYVIVPIILICAGHVIFRAVYKRGD